MRYCTSDGAGSVVDAASVSYVEPDVRLPVRQALFAVTGARERPTLSSSSMDRTRPTAVWFRSLRAVSSVDPEYLQFLGTMFVRISIARESPQHQPAGRLAYLNWEDISNRGIWPRCPCASPSSVPFS